MLYLVRHGSTDQHVLRPPGDMRPPTRDEWLLDHPLSEQGQAEAMLLQERFKRLMTADRYLCSPKRRTRETAAIAVPDAAVEIDDRLHEWCDDETTSDLYARTRWLFEISVEGVVVAFTHGNFIRAAIASAAVGDEFPRFEKSFHDTRRTMHIWNASITIVAPGPTGPEVVGVNLCEPIEQLAGRA